MTQQKLASNVKVTIHDAEIHEAEAAEVLGVELYKLAGMVARREVPCRRVGRETLFDRGELYQFRTELDVVSLDEAISRLRGPAPHTMTPEPELMPQPAVSAPPSFLKRIISWRHA